ncbi:MAG: CDP-glucose 4,6-dehydratase [Agarilytica sp.]
MNKEFWEGKKVFLTGHTGFKGGWLEQILTKFGARVTGYSKDEGYSYGIHSVCGMKDKIENCILGDIRDRQKLTESINLSQPDIVIHFAAQALVSEGYLDPYETWTTNMSGTLNLMDAISSCASVKYVAIATTDKTYRNKEWVWPYRESDELGGNCPYSSSKACTEFLIRSYSESIFKDRIKLVSIRAGNVIGGADWSENRLIPDTFRSISKKQQLEIRSPNSTRPWQHVLDVLDGYLKGVEHIAKDDSNRYNVFNIGPLDSNVSVGDVIDMFSLYVKGLDWYTKENRGFVETSTLALDPASAIKQLKWKQRLSIGESVRQTSEWYNCWLYSKENLEKVTNRQINEYYGGAS